MLHTFTTKKTRRHRYYVCSRLHNQGAASCPKARVSAGRFERFVIDQVQVMGQDAGLQGKTAESVAKTAGVSRDQLTSEARRIEQERRRLNDERSRLLSVVPPSTHEAAPLLNEVAELDSRLEVLEQRLAEVRLELEALRDDTADENHLRDALAGFTPIWEQLFPREQERILHLLIEKVTYDPDNKDVDIDLRPCGIDRLAEEAREAS
jgi:site-specific DNA recombinase